LLVIITKIIFVFGLNGDDRTTNRQCSTETNHIMLVKTRLRPAVGLWLSALLSYRHWL